jgi:preprotein translocase subunit SecG
MMMVIIIVIIIIIIIIIAITIQHRADWCSGNSVDFYSGGAGTPAILTESLRSFP